MESRLPALVARVQQGRRVRGGSGAWPHHLKSVPPPFYVGPTGCCIHPILYFKNVAPPFWFLAPLLLNPGDGPGAQPMSDGTFSKVWGTSASQKTVENLWFELVIVTS